MLTWREERENKEGRAKEQRTRRVMNLLGQYISTQHLIG